MKIYDIDGNVLSSGKTMQRALKKIVERTYNTGSFDLSKSSFNEIKNINFYGYEGIECVFGENYFINCDFSTFNFENCNIKGTTFQGCNFEWAENIIQFGPVGKSRRIGFAVMHDKGPMIQLGCFWGTKREALKEIKANYGAKSPYEVVVKAACRELEENY